MSHNFLFNAIFHKLLKAMDYDLSQEERTKGCPYCGGDLHQANYPRSPVGIPLEQREHYEDRYSYCCYRCRKRTTSPSLRFFGRRWYPGPLFIWISTLLHGGINKCCEQTEQLFGIILSKRTCKRWKGWWQEPERSRKLIHLYSLKLTQQLRRNIRFTPSFIEGF